MRYIKLHMICYMHFKGIKSVALMKKSKKKKKKRIKFMYERTNIPIQHTTYMSNRFYYMKNVQNKL